MAGRIRFPIKTPRLTIRPMEVGDAEALLSVYGDIETMQHLSSDLPTTVAEAREWVQTKIDLFDRDDQLSLWTVIHTESGQIVGDVGLQHEDYGSGPVVGLGGRGNRQFWRQGLGFEAASATIAAGFEQLDLPAIGAETRPENLPAQALLSKLGMQPAGTNPPRLAGLLDHSRKLAGAFLDDQSSRLPGPVTDQCQLVGVHPVQRAPMSDTDKRAIRQLLPHPLIK